jgi:hypothetical protein
MRQTFHYESRITNHNRERIALPPTRAKPVPEPTPAHTRFPGIRPKIIFLSTNRNQKELRNASGLPNTMDIETLQ